MNTNDAYGTFPSPAEVRIVRLLPGPIERLWADLSDRAEKFRPPEESR